MDISYCQIYLKPRLTIVHEALKSHRQMNPFSIQKLFNETTLKMIEQKKIATEKSKELSKTKEIKIEKESEILL